MCSSYFDSTVTICGSYDIVLKVNTESDDENYPIWAYISIIQQKNLASYGFVAKSFQMTWIGLNWGL